MRREAGVRDGKGRKRWTTDPHGTNRHPDLLGQNRPQGKVHQNNELSTSFVIRSHRDTKMHTYEHVNALPVEFNDSSSFQFPIGEIFHAEFRHFKEADKKQLETTATELIFNSISRISRQFNNKIDNYSEIITTKNSIFHRSKYKFGVKIENK